MQRLAETGKKQEVAHVSTPDAPPLPSSDLPTPPECFSRAQKETFRNLVVQLLAAKVPLQQVDGHSIAMAARCISAIEEAEEIGNSGEANFDQRLAALRLKYQYGNSLKDWLDRIGATVTARIRAIGKPAPERKAGQLAAILAARQGRKA